MDKATQGWISGTLGMLLSSADPCRRRERRSAASIPCFSLARRAVIAGLMAAALLAVLRQKAPSRRRPRLARRGRGHWGHRLPAPHGARVCGHTTSAHSLVFIGLLPLSTAIFGVLRGGEHPQPAFWLFAGLGAAIVAGFSLVHGHGGTSLSSDALMVAGVVVCGLGYAEGGRLSRTIGGWQVISWALVVALPIMVPLCVATCPSAWMTIPRSAWIGLIYVSVFSMLIGFMFWYRGLALGGIAAVGQLQLLQPFFGLIISATLLGEIVDPSVIAVVAAVILCVAGAKRFAAMGSARDRPALLSADLGLDLALEPCRQPKTAA